MAFFLSIVKPYDKELVLYYNFADLDADVRISKPTREIENFNLRKLSVTCLSRALPQLYLKPKLPL